MLKRKLTREITVGNVKIGNGNPIVIQSMTNTKTENVEATVRQIHLLEQAGCQVVRVAVPNMEAAENISAIKNQIRIPLVADIHFDHKLALKVMEKGIDKVRINPGNIGNEQKVLEVVQAAKHYATPIRIGINGGSLPKDILEKFDHKPSAEAMVAAAIREIAYFDKLNFDNICLSLKSSDVLETIKGYTLLSEQTDYPLHLGITEAGLKEVGTVKSSIGLGVLLFNGIGDTIRVSLTGDPVQEIDVAYNILKSLKLPTTYHRPEIISCPTCGRCDVNLENLSREVTSRVSHLKVPLKIAVMGCVVNGPGEAKEADYGVAGGKGRGLLFKKGIVVKTVDEADIIDALIELIKEDSLTKED